MAQCTARFAERPINDVYVRVIVFINIITIIFSILNTLSSTTLCVSVSVYLSSPPPLLPPLVMSRADMQMEMLRRIGVHKFNLVITDYSFWSTLSMLTEYGDDVILRYGKLQSVSPSLAPPPRRPSYHIYICILSFLADCWC